MCYSTNGNSNNFEDSPLHLMTIIDSVLYKEAFLFYDIVLAHCQHLYHPWYALTAFWTYDTCTKDGCPKKMSIDWHRSFDFCEVVVDIFNGQSLKRSENSCLSKLNLRWQFPLAIVFSIIWVVVVSDVYHWCKIIWMKIFFLNFGFSLKSIILQEVTWEITIPSDIDSKVNLAYLYCHLAI